MTNNISITGCLKPYIYITYFKFDLRTNSNFISENIAFNSENVLYIIILDNNNYSYSYNSIIIINLSGLAVFRVFLWLFWFFFVVLLFFFGLFGFFGFFIIKC